MAKKTAYMGMLTALAMVFSYIEFLLPINLGVPGVKLGLCIRTARGRRLVCPWYGFC